MPEYFNDLLGRVSVSFAEIGYLIDSDDILLKPTVLPRFGEIGYFSASNTMSRAISAR